MEVELELDINDINDVVPLPETEAGLTKTGAELAELESLEAAEDAPH